MSSEVSNELTLDDLVGKFVLDAVDFGVVKSPRTWREDEECSCVLFRLDGVVYVALENPDDGYRSMLDKVYVQEDASMENVFPPIEVVGIYRDRRDRYHCDIVEFVDVNTGKVVLEIGTDNTDDYYPSYVASFHPENMVTNK